MERIPDYVKEVTNMYRKYFYYVPSTTNWDVFYWSPIYWIPEHIYLTISPKNKKEVENMGNKIKTKEKNVKDIKKPEYVVKYYLAGACILGYPVDFESIGYFYDEKYIPEDMYAVIKDVYLNKREYWDKWVEDVIKHCKPAISKSRKKIIIRVNDDEIIIEDNRTGEIKKKTKGDDKLKTLLNVIERWKREEKRWGYDLYIPVYEDLIATIKEIMEDD